MMLEVSADYQLMIKQSNSLQKAKSYCSCAVPVTFCKRADCDALLAGA